MKTFVYMWIVAIATGMWLLFIQPTQASDIRSCHLLHPGDLHAQAVIYHLPATQLAHLQDLLMIDQSNFLEHKTNNGSSLPEQSEINSLKHAIAAQPGNATTWNNLGQKLFVSGQYADALVAYDHALLLAPDYSLVLANRCGVLSQLRKYTQALVSCNLALKGNKQWGAQGAALAWNNRGDALFNLERYQESLYSFEQALAINPGYQNAQHNRAIVIYQLEQIAKQQQSAEKQGE